MFRSSNTLCIKKNKQLSNCVCVHLGIPVHTYVCGRTCICVLLCMSAQVSMREHTHNNVNKSNCSISFINN